MSDCEASGLIVCKNLVCRLKTMLFNMNLMSIYFVPNTMLRMNKFKKSFWYEPYSRGICNLADKKVNI